MLRARRGLGIEADDVFVTRGSQMALSLIGRALLRPGDAVAVEALGYRPAWRALSQNGVGLVPVPIDAEGVVVSALAELVDRHPIRAVYVTPHHQYPTTVTLSASRRMALLDLARARRLAIVEDDYDHEFHYDGRPVLPLASADEAGVVIYIGTLSKVLAPGLRLGYFVAPRPVRDTVVGFRLDLDRQGDRVAEQAVAELMEDGEVQRHVWRARRVYLARREHAVEALGRLSEWIGFALPPGGLAVWATLRDPRLSARAWHRAAVDRGVQFQPGHSFTADESDLPAVRIGFAAVTERDFARAVVRLRDAARAVLRADRSSP
jgi:GntR family transcriptional regulator/MocR family aminotransferase